MKRLLITAMATAAMSVAVSASPAAADYRIPLFPCAVGIPGAGQVPANTPLYFSSGWTSGNRGLVQDAINAAAFTYTYAQNGTTTTKTVAWSPVTQDNFIFPGSWTSNYRVDFPPLAAGETATVTQTLAWAHPLADLGLPTSNSGSGLLYFDLQPVGSSAFGELTPITCTITGV